MNPVLQSIITRSAENHIKLASDEHDEYFVLEAQCRDELRVAEAEMRLADAEVKAAQAALHLVKAQIAQDNAETGLLIAEHEMASAKGEATF